MPNCYGVIQSSTTVVWKFKYSDLKNFESLHHEFRYLDFKCCALSADLIKPGYIRFCAVCGTASGNPRSPKVFIQLFAKFEDGTSTRIPIEEEKYNVTQEGTIIFGELPWPNREESLESEGEMSVTCKLSSQQIFDEKSPERDEGYGEHRAGLQRRDSTSITVVKEFKYSDLKNDAEVLQKFEYLDFECCALQADIKKPGYIRFCAVCAASVGGSKPLNPNVYIQLFVKFDDGTSARIPIEEEEYHVSNEGTIIFGELPWPNREESLESGGEMSMTCKLSLQEITEEESSERDDS